MCGIVLAGGNLSSGDLDMFNQLLYCDVFRGIHSTGVMMKRLNEDYVRVVKEAVPSAAFLGNQDYREASRGTASNTYATAPIWMVGHNRHATRGAVNSRNAHPFQHEHITLVHNGTLTNQSLLPDHRKYEVDSENICYSLAVWGAEKTIQNLDGAFTLIWHDNSDDTLHIIRNDERPFHLARVGVDWFGASEEDMLMWLLKRNKGYKNRVGEHFECKVGVEYIFDVKGPSRKMTLSEEKEHKLPVFTYASRYGTYSGTSWLEEYEDEYRGRAGNRAGNVVNHSNSAYLSEANERRKASEIKAQNKIASDAGLSVKRDQIIEFFPAQFEKYSGSFSAGKGKMTGYLFDEDANVYFELDAHNILEEDYKKSLENSESTYKGTISCIHKVDNMIRCIISTGYFVGLDGKKEPNITELDDDIPFDPEKDQTCVTGAGTTVNHKFWHSHSHGECGGCGKQIPWKDAPKALFNYQCYWHPECLEKISGDNKDGDDPDLIVCAVCAVVKYEHELDTEMSSFRKEDICKECAYDIRKRAEQVGNQLKTSGVLKGVTTPLNKDEPQWIRVVDKTTPRENEISLRITKDQFSRMILMGSVSVRRDIEFHELPLCYVERRVGNNFAYAMLPDGVKTPYEKNKEELPAEKPETFRRPTQLSLRKVVKSLDGNKSLEVTKALWATVGFCEYCYSQVAWKDVEECTLGEYNRIVCHKNECRGKLNGSKKNST